MHQAVDGAERQAALRAAVKAGSGYGHAGAARRMPDLQCHVAPGPFAHKTRRVPALASNIVSV